MSYTYEQLKYINYNECRHTRLRATAGSGKTKCIIARITHLIESQIYDANAVLILTFSRFTRDDFLNKLKSYGNNCVSVNSVSTIDKFAKTIVDENNTIDVSLLSYKLYELLDTSDKKVLEKNNILSKIRTVFIDEAQDLSEIQYKIFCLMREKLGIIVNLIGDPNQNIFQFRGSDCKFLMEFDAVEFKLTKNFRSHENIISFSNALRPYPNSEITCAKGPNGCKTIMMFVDHEKTLGDEIIDILKNAIQSGIDLSQFAILAPTRGGLRACGRSNGLCFVANILFKENLPFKSFYEESKEDINSDGIKFEPEKGHVNLLSYMGSKGLEFDYVIIIDADNCLINKLHYNQEKHNNDQYLLYVACSRAIHNMYIFSKCNYRNGQYVFSTNIWFKNIPEEHYIIDSNYDSKFFFSKIKYKTTINRENRADKLIEKLDCHNLNDISNLLDFQNRQIKHIHKIFHNDYSTIEKSSSIFLAKYVDLLFQTLYNIKMNRHHISFPEIEHIIEADNIVTGLSDDVIEWYKQNKRHMTWEQFNTIKNLDPLIKNAIIYNFDKTKPFNSHIIAVNGYYQSFILDQKIWIKNLYKKYIRCKNCAQIREILFYLIVIKHSIETQHYYHIKNKGQKYKHILTDFKDMFDEIEAYVDDLDYNFVKSHESIERWGLISRVDLISDDNKMWYIKCSNEISLKNTLMAIISYLMHNVDIIDENFSILNYDGINGDVEKGTIDSIDIIINYINLMKGEEISYSYSLKPDDISKIINILQRHTGDIRDLGTNDTNNNVLNNINNNTIIV